MIKYFFFFERFCNRKWNENRKPTTNRVYKYVLYQDIANLLNNIFAHRQKQEIVVVMEH